MTRIAFKILIDGTVHDVAARENSIGLAGIWCGGTLWEVDPQALREVLPAKWLPAFQRTSKKFWYPKNLQEYYCDEQDAKFPSLMECSMYLYGARTLKQIAHLRAIPYYVTEQAEEQ